MLPGNANKKLRGDMFIQLLLHIIPEQSIYNDYIHGCEDYDVDYTES